MEGNLARRRHLHPLSVVTPPLGLWTYLVECPKATVSDVELGIAHSEQRRKWEEIVQPCSQYSYYASAECAFCILHGVWPRCGLQQPKRQRQTPTLVGKSDGQIKRMRKMEEECDENI